MATRSYPLVRFEAKSNLCKRIGECLNQKLNEDQEFVAKMSRNAPYTQLIVVDRRNDPVTPLLNQWTYQAMVHELIGIKHNTVDM